MKIAIAILLSTLVSCTIDPVQHCAAGATLAVSMDPVPAFVAADITLYGSTSRTGRIPIDQLFVDDIAATSTSGDFDTFSVTLPKGRLLELRGVDGTVALTARPETTCSGAPMMMLPAIEIVVSPPQLLPPVGTLSIGSAFEVKARFDVLNIERWCSVSGVPGIGVTGNGMALSAVANTQLMPDGQNIVFEIAVSNDMTKTPIQITCADALGQSVTGTYTPLK
jgi:hypothetical protein